MTVATDPSGIADLLSACASVATRAAAVLREDLDAGRPATLADVGALRARLAAAVAAEPGAARRARLVDLALEARSVEVEAHRLAGVRRAGLFDRVERSLARIRDAGSSAAMVETVCREAVTACGFTRAMLSRVEHGTWFPWMTHFTERFDAEEEFVAWARSAAMPFHVDTLEAEVVRSGRAELVCDTATDPRVERPLAAPGGTRAYVVAPITPAGRVVSLLHCDRPPGDRGLDETDRDALWVFAEGFGRAFERAVMLERLASHREHVRSAFRETEDVMLALSHAEIEFVRDESKDWDTVALVGDDRRRAAIDDLLTARERDVLALIVQGRTNRAIAEALAISVGTVKSHVKHLLRKLGAANRTQAISMYLGSRPLGPDDEHAEPRAA
ncbi:LuxR C-terminal-related transcriptional regulator [Paraconexibacter antarcticus]|uniref:LuxR C-terminal-related transcriptional regulator n=1 Tax=Paraconexibacter antarcticus TaxID=2949664 RepID=A0ABY5DWW5_9ACTN|nr:LuxR C-terminal-related transcriptional regulator [Paraconexibacter antarcticus]UTI65429.1 LuxR C-terminal-related transcriptional regulator [Paraconexibacter antarcticus]